MSIREKGAHFRYLMVRCNLHRWLSLPRPFLLCLVFVSGCMSEANFELSPESRLPKWFGEQYQIDRQNLVVTLDTYAYPSERRYVFKLQEKGKIYSLETLRGSHAPLHVDQSGVFRFRYPVYLALTINGVTDIIEFRKMEPTFYMTDDPQVWQRLEQLGETKFNESSLYRVE